MPEEFDLSAVSRDALSHLEAAPVETPVPPTSEPVAPVEPLPVPAETTIDPVVATPKTYKVKVDGEESEVPEDELINGYSRTAKFTKSMMQLAEERKAFALERQTADEREKAINEFFRDPANIARYYESVTGQKLSPAQAQAVAAGAPPPPLANGDDFATVATVQQSAREQAEKAQALQAQMNEQMQRTIAETQKWTQEQIQKAHVEADQQRKAVEYHGEINSTVASLIEKYPALNAIDDIANILCYDAQRMAPTSIAEAKAALLNVATARAERLTAQFTEMQKTAAVKAAKLQTQGIEPPGGTAPLAPATSFKLGDKGLTNAAIEWMTAQGKK